MLAIFPIDQYPKNPVIFGMYKLPILSIFLLLALEATSQQKTFATASATIVNPVGTNLEMGKANAAENILSTNLVIKTQPAMERLILVNNNTAIFSASIHIANLQIVGSSYTMYSIIFPLEMKLSNQTRKSYLQLHCYTLKQEKGERNDEMVMINATVSIPSNQLLGNYVADDQLTIMVNYN